MLGIILFYLYIAIAIILIIESFKSKKLRLLFIPLCITWIVIPVYRQYPFRQEPYVDKAKVIISESDNYSSSEINSAIECVRNDIHKCEDHCRLLKIEFDDNKRNVFSYKNDKFICITAYLHYSIKSEYWTYDNAEKGNIIGNVEDTYILLFDSSANKWNIYAK